MFSLIFCAYAKQTTGADRLLVAGVASLTTVSLPVPRAVVDQRGHTPMTSCTLSPRSPAQAHPPNPPDPTPRAPRPLGPCTTARSQYPVSYPVTMAPPPHGLAQGLPFHLKWVRRPMLGQAHSPRRAETMRRVALCAARAAVPHPPSVATPPHDSLPLVRIHNQCHTHPSMGVHTTDLWSHRAEAVSHPRPLSSCPQTATAQAIPPALWEAIAAA